MSKIAKGSAMAAAVLGVLAFLFGLGVSISAWTLSSKVSDIAISSSNSVNIKFKSYWWGGLSYVIPGILGIIAGCTRNVTAMVFYMIFNILSLIGSIAVSIIVALLIVAWAAIEAVSNQGSCINTPNLFYAKQCTCTDYDGRSYVINNMSCSDVKDIQTILAAIIALAAISSLIAFISSYVSCCALCNQEPDTPATIIVQGGAGNYQPPNVIISNSSQQQFTQQPYPNPGYPAYNQPPPYGNPQQPYAQQPYDNAAPQYSSKAGLVKSDVI